LITSRLLPPFHRDCICGGFLYCSLFNESEYWSKLVEERRVLAQDMPDDKCKQMMFQIAENYEHLAKRIGRP
jgi:hypothetical protein